MAKKVMRTSITIPVFYHENKEGRIIIDNEYMREYFENQLKKLYLETKLGRKEFWKNKLNNKL
tara:strand:+ start:2645 stop:2833 length:189 start_codon:yes stop_codon:yes gene_type:complete